MPRARPVPLTMPAGQVLGDRLAEQRELMRVVVCRERDGDGSPREVDTSMNSSRPLPPSVSATHCSARSMPTCGRLPSQSGPELVQIHQPGLVARPARGGLGTVSDRDRAGG